MSALDSAVDNLVKRLETVTSRLEAVEKKIATGSVGAGSAAAAPAASGDASASVADYNDLISTYIKPLVSATAALGSDELKQQVALVEKAINAQRDMLQVAASSKKPAQDSLGKIIEPTSKLMGEIVAIRDAQRKSKQFNHLSTLSEGINALGWVMVEPTPGPFVNEARGSSEFYSNKILVEFKKTDQSQVDWVGHWNNFLKELANFIKKHHTTGLTWNPKGGEASAAPAAAAAPKAAGGPPPPAPKITAEAPKASAAPSTSGLFAELNKGAAITSGLKKVTKDMKSKYDPSKSSLISADAAEKKAVAAPKAAAAKKGTPKFELSGNKWLVEWQENNNLIEIKETELRQTVYIYKCEKSVIRVSGKVNSITIDGCKRVSVVFDDALALCEIVNSNSVEVQCVGRVPAMTVDKCSGVQLFISKDGLDVEIVTSKSDAMNVLIPDPAGGLDPVEIAVPEQYKTTIKQGKLHTSTLEHV
eukprot:TRINITY_DN1202_c0_g1_i1.p1 TRINITY_DN1202_c0_g1~~TRINITY_DN1202_c0_g1_i1.p1  ORF type:complete len:476 (+),score=297.32 TRINITY_DN1202_c0_g1_i1:31-1458(+)